MDIPKNASGQSSESRFHGKRESQNQKSCIELEQRGSYVDLDLVNVRKKLK